MPTPKQMEKLQAKRPSAPLRSSPEACPLGPSDDMPPEYWDALLRDAAAGASGPTTKPDQGRPLSEVPQHVLRVSCSRCGRIVEIQKADVVRLYGPDAVWRQVGQRLLDNTCQQRTGRYEEDGCWPSFET